MTINGTAHASAVLLGPVGLLVCGPSGGGKSALCHALVDHHAARWVGDDQLCLALTEGHLWAKPHPRLAGKAERRGKGIVGICYAQEGRMTHQIVLQDGPAKPSLPSPVLAHTWQPNLKNSAALSQVLLPTLFLPRLSPCMAAERAMEWLPAQQGCGVEAMGSPQTR
ncbi:MAG: serine kinase [Pseudomonadota bacterium]